MTHTIEAHVADDGRICGEGVRNARRLFAVNTNLQKRAPAINSSEEHLTSVQRYALCISHLVNKVVGNQGLKWKCCLRRVNPARTAKEDYTRVANHGEDVACGRRILHVV